MHLLLVENEERLAKALKRGLESKGYAVDWLSEPQKALDRILRYRDEYDLILLDFVLPGTDGAQLAQQVRAEGVTTPLIVLTASNETAHKTDLLNRGASDYLVKPFSLEELVSRLSAVLRRPNRGKPGVLRVGPLEMDLATRVVRKEGKEVSLTLKEFSLLECFMQRPGEALSREQLFEQVWDADNLSWSNVLDVHMKNLRKKLGNGQLFETVRGVGYRLVDAA